jgi:hypothetical protein
MSPPPRAGLRRLQPRGSSSNSSIPRSSSLAAREVLVRPTVAIVPCIPRRKATPAGRSRPLMSSTSTSERNLKRRRPFLRRAWSATGNGDMAYQCGCCFGRPTDIFFFNTTKISLCRVSSTENIFFLNP